MSDNMRKIINIIIAVLVSLGAWIFVVYNNDPMTEVKYKEIPITFKGEDALANKGLGVSQVSTEMIDVTLRQRRIDTNDISSDNITVIADVSDAEEGENGISLKISGPEGTQVAEAERRSISVEVEESDSVQKAIDVDYSEKLAGYEPVTAEITSNKATAIGAKSEIARVDRIAALIGFEETTDRLKNFTVALSALDEDGSVIEHVVIYPGEVNFYAYTGMTKEVPLKVVLSDSNRKDDGYIRTYTAPESVTIKGAENLIEDVTEIKTVPVDISGTYQDEEITLECDMPDGVYLSSDTTTLIMKVKVTEKPSENEDEQ